MIGNGGKTMIGRQARKTATATGTGKPGGLLRISKATQKGQPLKWFYTLERPGALGAPQEVAGDNDDWELAARPAQETEEQRTVREYLEPKITPQVQGSVATWLQENEPVKAAVSVAINMSDELFTDGKLMYLWTSGAADCVAVAAYSKAYGKAYLIHADRTSTGKVINGVRSLGDDVVVYLSNMYMKSAEMASQTGTVKDIVMDLSRAGINAVACYGTGYLAINGRTGEVLSWLPKPRPDPMDKKAMLKEQEELDNPK
jgi:hypothetical protein